MIARRQNKPISPGPDRSWLFKIILAVPLILLQAHGVGVLLTELMVALLHMPFLSPTVFSLSEQTDFRVVNMVSTYTTAGPVIVFASGSNLAINYMHNSLPFGHHTMRPPDRTIYL